MWKEGCAAKDAHKNPGEMVTGGRKLGVELGVAKTTGSKGNPKDVKVPTVLRKEKERRKHNEEGFGVFFFFLSVGSKMKGPPAEGEALSQSRLACPAIFWGFLKEVELQTARPGKDVAAGALCTPPHPPGRPAGGLR